MFISEIILMWCRLPLAIVTIQRFLSLNIVKDPQAIAAPPQTYIMTKCQPHQLILVRGRLAAITGGIALLLNKTIFILK